jgi:predicted esterase YcpF (UPF0227 family)
MITDVIYLHGFLSSPQSEKAQITKTYFSQFHPEVHLHIPTLPGVPNDAITVVEDLLQSLQSASVNEETSKLDTPISVAFIGSSMGGFLSTFFAEKLGCKAALINPAVRPFDLLQEYFGEHQNPYTSECFNVDETTVGMLRKLNVEKLNSRQIYFVLLQTGDETLDYRLAEQKYGSEYCRIEQGGSHAFDQFETRLDEISSFLLSKN